MRIAVLSVVTLTLTSPVWPGAVAAAAGGVSLGGGAGITVGGGALCTLTTIGHDGAGDLVGFTSAHCGGPGAPVTATGADGAVGSVVADNPDLDYAVIRFDPAAVTPIPDFDGYPINGIGPSPAAFQQACQQSRTTGRTCYLMSPSQGPDPGTLLARACGQAGDDGAPVTVDEALIGMIHGGFVPGSGPCPYWWISNNWQYPARDRPEVVSITAILDDVNTRGGPGAGFTPVG